jgi:hypothetical protein
MAAMFLQMPAKATRLSILLCWETVSRTALLADSGSNTSVKCVVILGELGGASRKLSDGFSLPQNIG